MTEEQFLKLVEYIKAVAKYEADENFNRNDGNDWLRLRELENELRNIIKE